MIPNTSLNQSNMWDFSESIVWPQRTKMKYNLHYEWCRGDVLRTAQQQLQWKLLGILSVKHWSVNHDLQQTTFINSYLKSYVAFSYIKGRGGEFVKRSWSTEELFAIYPGFKVISLLILKRFLKFLPCYLPNFKVIGLLIMAKKI